MNSTRHHNFTVKTLFFALALALMAGGTVGAMEQKKQFLCDDAIGIICSFIPGNDILKNTCLINKSFYKQSLTAPSNDIFEIKISKKMFIPDKNIKPFCDGLVALDKKLQRPLRLVCKGYASPPQELLTTISKLTHLKHLDFSFWNFKIKP